MNKAQLTGAKIKALRIKNNFTQQELAEKLHYKSRSTINKIELGINGIHPTKIDAFAKALNTSPGVILDSKNEVLCDNKINITFEDGSVLNFSFDNNAIQKVINFLTSLEQ